MSETAFIFPGQGSQKVGMLSDISEQHTCVKSTFEVASQVLGYDLWDLIQNGPEERLSMTEVTQPALLSSSIAILRVCEEASCHKPAYVAGHSLGEWSALVCAGVLAFEDAIKLVRARGQYMQEAVPVGVGSMAAIIGLEDEAVEQECESASEAIGQVVSPVNYNSPGQLVIAGEKEAVELAIEKLKSAGAKKAMPLPVSAPFHTSLMKPAADRLAAEIHSTEFNAPVIPVLHNVTADVETDPKNIKNIMIEQVYSPVRWVACIQSLVDRGVTRTFECGPGKVLSGLNRRINKSLESQTADSIESLTSSISLLNAQR